MKFKVAELCIIKFKVAELPRWASSCTLYKKSQLAWASLSTSSVILLGGHILLLAPTFRPNNTLCTKIWCNTLCYEVFRLLFGNQKSNAMIFHKHFWFFKELISRIRGYMLPLQWPQMENIFSTFKIIYHLTLKALDRCAQLLIANILWLLKNMCHGHFP